VADVLTRVRLLENGDLVDRKPSELGFAYRHSRLKENAHIVVERVPPPPATAWRWTASWASTRSVPGAKGLHGGLFLQNPVLPTDEDSAGQLPEAAGAKEIRDGGAGVLPSTPTTS
jgi:UDP-N-acetylenolpyruvoylglucosamine reductase